MITDSFVEVTLNDPQSFLKIKETLTRIGIASKKDNTLYQSCHILHKRGKYYITHFKEMFLLDGKPSTFTDEDRLRRNAISALLEQWGLLTVINPAFLTETNMKNLKVIKHGEKGNWTCVPKYNVGKSA
jgi:hypothetical protein